MLTADKRQHAQHVQSAEFKTVEKEMECIHDKLVICSSKAMIQNAIACIRTWSRCLPLGGDGMGCVEQALINVMFNRFALKPLGSTEP
jgi:hypothetical protein